MKQSVFQRILHFFLGNYIERQVAWRLIEQRRLDKESEQANRLRYADIETGKPVIVVSNEWQDPTIGIIVRHELVTQAQVPIPVVLDYLEMKEFMCFGKCFEYSDQRLETLVQLSPSNRWSLMMDYGHQWYECNPDYAKPLTPLEDIRTILTKNGFFQKVKVYQRQEDLEVVDNAVFGSKHLLRTTDLKGKHDGAI